MLLKKEEVVKMFQNLNETENTKENILELLYKLMAVNILHLFLALSQKIIWLMAV